MVPDSVYVRGTYSLSQAPRSPRSTLGMAAGINRASPLEGSGEETGRHVAGLVGHAWGLLIDVGLLTIVYLSALALGILVDHSSEMSRHYQIRGTLFPVEHGQTQFPRLLRGHRE